MLAILQILRMYILSSCSMITWSLIFLCIQKKSLISYFVFSFDYFDLLVKINSYQYHFIEVKIHTFFKCIYYRAYSMVGIIICLMFVKSLQFVCNKSLSVATGL